MKKAVVAAVALALLGAAYVGATAYTGTRIQAAYEARMAMVEQRLPFLRVVDRQSDKGLFSSSYGGSVRIGCVPSASAEGAATPLVIGFRDHVQHGPLPGLAGFGAATIDSQIVLPSEAPEALRRYVAGLQPQDIRTRVGFGGAYRTTVRLPAGEFSSAQGQVQWPALRLTGDGTMDGSASSFDATLPALSFRATDKAGTDGASVKLVNMRMQGRNGGEGSFWLRPGISTVEVEHIELQADSGGNAFTAQLGKVRYASEMSATQDLMSGRVSITADATLRLGGDAKPIELDRIELQESVRRLHLPTLQKVMDASMAELYDCDAPAKVADEANLEARLARAQDMLRQLAQLLPHDPEFSLDKLAFGYEGQRGEISYSASVKNVDANNLDGDAAMRRIVERNLLLKAEARLPVAWVEQLGARAGNAAGAGGRVVQANTMLDMAIGQGYVVRDGDFITSSLSLEQGAITLNGKPLGPPRGAAR